MKKAAWQRWQLRIMTKNGEWVRLTGTNTALLWFPWDSPSHATFKQPTSDSNVSQPHKSNKETLLYSTQMCDHKVPLSTFSNLFKAKLELNNFQPRSESIWRKKKGTRQHASAKVSSPFQSFTKHQVYGWLGRAPSDRQIYKVSIEPNQKQSENSFSLVSFSAWMAALCYYK